MQTIEEESSHRSLGKDGRVRNAIGGALPAKNATENVLVFFIGLVANTRLGVEDPVAFYTRAATADGDKVGWRHLANFPIRS